MIAEDVLFLLAHQDDEAGAVATVAREIRDGHRCWLLYLTDGGKRVSPSVRDAETQAALQHFGGGRSKALFLSDLYGRIPDGELMFNLPRAAAMLAGWIEASGISPARVHTIDWEGGHVDHDAVHLVALSLLGSGIRVDGFSLYNAYRRPPKFFRVRSLVPASGEIASHPVSWCIAITASCAPLWYPSQRRTWAVLGPGFAARALLDHRERLRVASVGRTQHRPHRGKLLYEALFGVPYESFEKASRAFRESLS
jgi:LmbE family N-acetylglucosaminyl deacetylase